MKILRERHGVILTDFYTSDDVKHNPNYVFVFDDNLKRFGTDGQAKACRGMPNTIGIVTKRNPDYEEESFLTDNEDVFVLLTIAVDLSNVRELLDMIQKGDTKKLVLPKDGIGTGRAELEQRAPKLYKMIKDELNRMLKDHFDKMYFITK